jgi:hypothetical protein
MTCEQFGPEVVALAFGALSADEAAKVEAHLAACAPCRAELDATKRLALASREAPQAGPSAESLERLISAFRAERDAGGARAPADVPQPAAMPSRRARILSIGLPLAAAAAVVAAVMLRSHDRSAQVLAGSGWVLAAGTTPDAGTKLGKGVSEFEFAEGDEISSGEEHFSVRIDVAPGAAGGGSVAADRPPPGRVEMTLRPGARIVRRSESDLELVAGTVDVAAGPLAAPLTIRAAPGYATIRGTRLTATTTEHRLVVSVFEGAVELGRDGGPAETLEAGKEGLVDAGRLIEHAAGGAGFLTPRVSLAVDSGRLLRIRLEAGDGGPVSILPFDDSAPRFLLRLKGDDGREREVKLQGSMLSGAPPETAGRTWRLDGGRSYELAVDPSALGVAPGRYEARLRYMSYRARSDGAEWLGIVESGAVRFEVLPR